MSTPTILFITAGLFSAVDMILYFGAGENRFRHTPWIILPGSGYWLFHKYGFNRKSK